MCPIKNKLLAALIILLCSATNVLSAEKPVVSLVTSDADSRSAVQAVRAIREDYPGLKKHLTLRPYSSGNLTRADLNAIAGSRIVFVFMFDRQTANRMQPFLERVIERGGDVYTVNYLFPGQHKELGFTVDEKVCAYYEARGSENLKNGLLFALKRDLDLEVSFEDPAPYPDAGLYEHHSSRIIEDVEEFKRVYGEERENFKADAPWVGIIFYVSDLAGGQMDVIDTVIETLEDAGLNVLPAYGYPSEGVVEKYFLDEKGQSRIRVLVAIALKLGVNPEKSARVLGALDVPVIDPIILYTQSADQWRESEIGLDINERTWQIAKPELAGIAQPTVIGAKETARDPATGIVYMRKKPMPERVRRVVNRVQAWLNLQNKPNPDKHVAVLYYNYPPGKQTIGASYLNVLPESLWEILQKLKNEGYDARGAPGDKSALQTAVFHHRNLGNWAPAELDAFVRQYDPPRVSIKQYEKWLGKLPPAFIQSVEKAWGPPGESDIMVWRDQTGQAWIIIPALQYGNILLTAQPPRGWGQNVTKLYHDTTIPPHHQYVAFYLYLKHKFGADAIIHVGTHGTHEWLSGKEAGLAAEDPPEALIQDMPNIYPYIVDDVGEGIQAKRRGQAVVIDHMTPPLDDSGLNPELDQLSNLIDKYNVATQKSAPLAKARLDEINRLAGEKGLLTDLGLKNIETDEDVEQLEHHLKRIAEKTTPFGLHTFGKVPEEKYRRSTAEAILKAGDKLPPARRKAKLKELDERIIAGAQRELDSLVQALSGRYVPAGTGNDPIRNPDSLPTGKNFYSFDPSRIPSPDTYKMGAQLARELVEDYRNRHGQYPDKLSFTLWAVETIRHEGIVESQIMHLLGVRPTWDKRGKVTGVEVIPSDDLHHPRIDTIMVPSGLYRDVFSNLMALLDKSVSLARDQDESDNILRANVLARRDELLKRGISKEKALRLASVRIFTEEPGSYGTGLCDVIPLSGTWDNEEEVADVYFLRMSHMFGQGFWGNRTASGSGPGVEKKISKELFKKALSGTKMSVHSLSSNVYATLDNDDFFQYLGGTAMAVRAVDGETPEMYVSDMSNPNAARQVTLARVMGTEMRTRYLNPKWIDKMMAEGYAGARFVDKVVEHLWGWQVTAPEVVDSAKWQEMYETYVEDKYDLNLKQKFKEAGNTWAHQSIVARMLEVVRKNYWDPDREVVQRLAKEYAESVKKEGLACCDHTCNNPALTEYTRSTLTSVPGLENLAKEMADSLEEIKRTRASSRPKASNPGNKTADASSPSPEPAEGQPQQVEGYEMEETTSGSSASAPIPYLFLVFFLGFLGVIFWGWKRNQKAG